MKKLALFCNCQLNYDRITALNLNPVGVYSILQSDQIKSGILSHLHRNSNNSQISQSDWYRRNREVWASVRRGFSEESLLTERAIIKSKSTGEQGTHHHKPRGRGVHIVNQALRERYGILYLYVQYAGLSVGGCVIACEHAGMRANVHLGAIDHAPGNKIFPLKRVMSHWGIHIGKLHRQDDFCFKTYLVTP